MRYRKNPFLWCISKANTVILPTFVETQISPNYIFHNPDKKDY